MALTRAFLRSIGLEEDKIQAVIEAHSESVNALKDENKKTADELEKAKEDLKKAGEADTGWKAKHDKLQADFDQYKADEAAKAELNAKESAYKALLTEVGVSAKHVDKIVRLAGVGDLEYKDGAFTDKENLIKDIKTEWSEFITTSGQRGVDVGRPPAGGTGGTAVTKESIMAIKDTKKRQQAIADNMELFTGSK